MCLLRIHCESLLPETFKGITPQLYGDFSTYTPKVHLTFLFFQLLDVPRGGSGGKCGNAEPVEMRTAQSRCTFICFMFNKSVFGAIAATLGFRNRPEAALKLQDYVESG